ncbi:ribonuclease P 40kDa subunit-domain-containing protein [Collybia nuda]|uniref:Ribonuclease P 40kDa subunit-domain-containing protein n=1 Tax=Collybia nuda TaxID=64659 RepID=A0A9P5YCA2_9AGAR|nr:ribonuclease P 40kDa subunit-domain-containing protein [Collybia nuda]
MDVPPLERRRLKIVTGVLPSNSTKLAYLGASHPFTQQVDVIFPSSDDLESALSVLGTRYGKGKVKLSDLINDAGPFSDVLSNPESGFAMLGKEQNDDVWCIDPRGLLTLSVSKDTYERLGLVGRKLPFKTHADRRVISLSMKKGAESVANKARRNTALELWDKRRDEAGVGPWDVFYCVKVPMPNPVDSRSEDVKCQVTKLVDVRIPQIQSLPPRPSNSSSSTSDDEEDWSSELGALFEWVGMATLGSQRLSANDRVDPYVSVYNCPTPSYVGSITRLRWTGFLGPDFVQSIVDTALTQAATLPGGPATNSPFISITSHALSSSPVSYISPSTHSGTVTPLETHLRVSRADGEDTWCLLAVPGSSGSQSISWAIVESLGQLDTRWG